MPPQPNQSPSFMQQYAFAKWLMQFPALTLMVILRRDIGYRLLNPLVLLATFGLLFVVAVLATPGNEAARPLDLAIFAGLGFLSGIAQRIRRWWDLNRDVWQHSYYIGSSPFEQRWLPGFFRRNRRAARLIDPLFCAAIGLIIFPYSRALAMWLVFSAFCLRAYEDSIFQRERNFQLDTADSLIESERQMDTVERFSESAPQNPNPPDAPGVPTGIGNDISEQVKKQKNKKPTNHEYSHQ